MANSSREFTKVFLDRCKADPSKITTFYDTLAPMQFVPSRTTNGRGSFYFRYQIGGKRRKLRLGAWPGMKLTKARKAARDAREAVAAGIDPAAERDARKAEAAAQAHAAPPAAYAETVEDFVEKHHKARKGNAFWKEPRRLLLKHGEPWAKRAVADITKRDVLDVLDDLLAEGKGYTANRFYSAAKTFFRWCRSRDIIAADPMDGVEKPFDGERARDRVYTDDEIKALWQAADELPKTAGAFVKLLILTGKRKGALASMRWDELEDGVWTPPADGRRSGANKRTHVTALSGLAQRVVAGLSKVERNPYVFVGRHDRGHLVPGTPLQKDVREKSGVEDFFFHACRHTLETRLAALRVPPHLRDLLLDHAPARGAGAGYDHHDYAEEMGEAVEAWASEIERIVGGKGVARLR